MKPRGYRLGGGCLTILILVGFICLLNAGCGVGEKTLNDTKSEREKSMDACIKVGGVPVLGFWTGQLKDCMFPPSKGN